MEMKLWVRSIAVCVCMALLLSGITLLLAGRALADNNARDYIPAPAGILAVLTYYENVTGQNFYVKGSTGPGFTYPNGVSSSGHGGTDNLGLSENIGILRVIYFCDIPMPWGPMRASPQFLVPFGSVTINEGTEYGNSPIASSTSTGLSAPFILSQFWIVNDDSCKNYVAFTPFIFFPAGAYNDTKAANIGTNNWQFREEINGTKGFELIPGHFAYIEATLGSSQFTNNDDAGPFSQTMVQKPTFTAESHLSYDLTKTVFIAGDYYGHYAGSYRIDPLYESGNPEYVPTQKVGALGETSVGASLAYSFAPGFQLMAQYRTDVAVANGPAANIFLLRFLWATDLNGLLGNPQAK